MSSKKSMREHILMLLKNIINETFGDLQVNVYLFGSWARNEEKRTSDIDIGILSEDLVSSAKWVELRERIEESVIPYKVDLVDLSRANPIILEKVKREGILWRDYLKGCNSQQKH